MKQKKMKSKKGMELTLNTIIIAALVLIVFIVIVLVFGRYFGLEVNIFGGWVDGLEKDYDNDGIKDTADLCPCAAEVTVGCERLPCKNIG